MGKNVNVIAKKAMYVIVVVVLLAVAACIVPLPLKVNTLLEGVQWENESGSQLAEKCTVKAEGWYYCYLFKDDIFKGSIRISCNDKSLDNDTLELTFCKYPQYGGKCAQLWIFDKGENRNKSLGEIVVKGAFQSVLIRLNDGAMVSVPAENRDEAISLASKLSHRDLIYD